VSWAVWERDVHAEQCDEVFAALLSKGTASKDVLPVPGKASS